MVLNIVIHNIPPCPFGDILQFFLKGFSEFSDLTGSCFIFRVSSDLGLFEGPDETHKSTFFLVPKGLGRLMFVNVGQCGLNSIFMEFQYRFRLGNY